MSDESKEQPSIYSLSRSALEDRRAIDPALRAEFERLVAQHSGRIRAVCFRITGDRELSDELTQDALLTAYRKLPDYEGRSSLSTWICGIAKHLAFNAVRRRREVLTEDGLVDPGDDELSVLRTLSRAERESVMRDASEAVLDSMEQEAVFLRYVEGLPIKQIDAILELQQASGARGLLQRCRKKLGRELKSRLEELGHGSSFVRTRA